MSIADFLQSKLVEKLGWSCLDKTAQAKLLNELKDMPLIDISVPLNLPILEVMSVSEIQSMITTDKSLQKKLMAKYGKQLTISQVIQIVNETPILQDLIVSKTSNKVNRALSYICTQMQTRELTKKEGKFLEVIFAKFGGPIGCPTPELFQTKCKSEWEDLLELNTKRVEKHGKKVNKRKMH